MRETVREYLHQFLSVDHAYLTTSLTENKWEELNELGMCDAIVYSTAKIYLPGINHSVSKKLLAGHNRRNAVYLENADFNSLHNFYNAHGLLPCTENEISVLNAAEKIQKALKLIFIDQPLGERISMLAKAIQVLQQEDEEIDISYSHPVIPFTIFVSVSKSDTDLSHLRIAESIIHESMHLELTLIERIEPLINHETNELFYSPWRDEMRPIQGVLHGLYVFRIILEYYRKAYLVLTDEAIKDYVGFRIEQIEKEIKMIKNFAGCKGLTGYGATLAENLLTLN